MLSSPPPPPERLELALLGWAKTWATPQPLPRACLNRPVVRMPDSICANSALVEDGSGFGVHQRCFSSHTNGQRTLPSLRRSWF